MRSLGFFLQPLYPSFNHINLDLHSLSTSFQHFNFILNCKSAYTTTGTRIGAHIVNFTPFPSPYNIFYSINTIKFIVIK